MYSLTFVPCTITMLVFCQTGTSMRRFPYAEHTLKVGHGARVAIMLVPWACCVSSLFCASMADLLHVECASESDSCVLE